MVDILLFFPPRRMVFGSRRFSPGPKCDSVPGPNAIRPWAQIPSGLGSSSQTQLCKKSYCTYRRESPLGISLLFLASVYPMMLSRHILVLILCLYELKCAHTIIHPQTPRHRHTHTHTHTHIHTYTHTHRFEKVTNNCQQFQVCGWG